MEYIFTLKYRLSDHDCDQNLLVERLGEVGCDDALIGMGTLGRLALEFTREAKTAKDALHNALAEVKQAVSSAKLIEALPDYVGLSEVAEIMGMSRQNLRKLMRANPSSFPAPIHEGNPSIWHLVEVLAWLESKGYAVDRKMLEVSRATLDINLAKEARRFAPKRAGERAALAI